MRMEISKQSSSAKTSAVGKQRNYNEVVEYLDQHWSIPLEQSLDRVQKLDAALGHVARSVSTILVGGTNGKSLTIHFASKLLKEEGLKVGSFSAPHILTYNERISVSQETIANKTFTDIGNEVINAAEAAQLRAHSSELLVMMALRYFNQQKVDVALFEVSQVAFDPAYICDAKVATITRVTEPNALVSSNELEELTRTMMSIVKKGTAIVSGDQNKNNLHIMQQMTEERGGEWAMPIRKLAPLSYPFEQLHGRCAALAERIAQLFLEKYVMPQATIVKDGLLIRQNGQRGRPTLDAKRKAELNPRKTIEQFWKETANELPGRFQLLEKEKPTILLDTANNIDALKNLLLGIRLLHYQRPLKGLSLVIGATKDAFHTVTQSEEFTKLLRYFFKKTSGQIFICPLNEMVLGAQETSSWDIEQVANDIKSMKMKAKACKNFEEAFDLAKKSVDERHGLVVITGSLSLVSAYWRAKGIKKF